MIGKKIIRFDSIDSTSNYVANALLSGTYSEGDVILAQYQTSGRGQRDSVWQSSPGENLLISFAIHADFLSLHQQFLLSKAVAVAIYNYLHKAIPRDVWIKWPNDILVDDKKISGMLIETKTVAGKRYAIIGLGLNINQTEFDPSLQATSLSIELGHKVATLDVANSVIAEINKQLAPISAGNYDEIRGTYLKYLYGTDDWVKCEANGNSFEGKIIDVDDRGLMLLKSKKGRSATYDVKEIKLIY